MNTFRGNCLGGVESTDGALAPLTCRRYVEVGSSDANDPQA